MAPEMKKAQAWRTVETSNRHEVPLQAQKMEVLGRLAGAVIHDLNNLLTVIQLNAGMIESGQLETREVLAAAGKIEQASVRAADLTRKVLNFSRDQPDETEDVNLPRLVTDLSRLLEPLVARRVRIEITSGHDDLWVHGNRGAIEQAIMNLVLNGVDSMHGGGRLALLFLGKTISAGESADCAAGDYVGVAVRDEGPGIAPENRGRLFEPFFTTKSTGTGMGLAIVDRIARQHGGSVDFDSEPGQGAEFRLWLPRIAAPEHYDDTHADSQAIEFLGSTVLLVEDDPGILAVAQRLLEAQGLRVLASVSAEEALEIWQRSRSEVDLLFTDVVLPGALSGRDLALTLLRERPTLPVLYMSGYSGVWQDQSYFTASNFLPKPFPPHALRNAVKKALGC
jgi:two-component system, cell cycle sensor histidine kinase and response regulator CckA